MYATAYNASESPAIIDAEGRTIEALGFGTVDTTADEVKNLTDAGTLHVFPDLEPGPGQADTANDAAENTREVKTRAGELEALDKADLAKLASRAGIGQADELHKDDLVTRLAFRTEFDYEKTLSDIREEEAEAKKAETSSRRRKTTATSTAQAGPGGPETPEEA